MQYPCQSIFTFLLAPPCQVFRVWLHWGYANHPRILEPQSRRPPSAGAVYAYGSVRRMGQGRRASRGGRPPCGGGSSQPGPACRGPPCARRPRGTRRRYRCPRGARSACRCCPRGSRCACSGCARSARGVLYHRPRRAVVPSWGVYRVTRPAIPAPHMRGIFRENRPPPLVLAEPCPHSPDFTRTQAHPPMLFDFFRAGGLRPPLSLSLSLTKFLSL